MEGHKSVKIAMPLIQLVLINHLRHISKNYRNENVPVAVYSYALGTTVKEMKEEAKTFYENASPYSPTFYWIDVEEATMSDMNKGVQAFLKRAQKTRCGKCRYLHWNLFHG